MTLLIGDILAIAAAVCTSILIRLGAPWLFLLSYKTILVLSVMSVTLLFYISDLYNIRQDQTSLRTVSAVLFDCFLGVALTSLFLYFYPHSKLGRGIFLLIAFIAPVFILAWRIFGFSRHLAALERTRIGVIGSGPDVEAVKKLSSDHAFDLHLLPYEVTDPPMTGNGPPSASLAGGIEKSLADTPVDALVLSSSSTPDVELARALINARFKGILVLDATEFIRTVSGKLPVELIDEKWFLTGSGFRLFENRMLFKVKRLADITLAIAFLLPSIPLLPLIALGIKLSSPGPVFYSQDRVGLGGRVFQLFKFRSMDSRSEPDGPAWAAQSDPRVHPFGRFLRRFHLDELPQLLNILKGEMSLVGPRPERPAFVEELKTVIPLYGLRSAVRPGLTGWAQVNYPYGASVEDAVEKLRYDLYYIQYASLVLDLQIVLKTIGVSLRRKGSR